MLRGRVTVTVTVADTVRVRVRVSARDRINYLRSAASVVCLLMPSGQSERSASMPA